MSIWTYKEQSPEPQLSDFAGDMCPFCSLPLSELRSDQGQLGVIHCHSGVFACPGCGWWCVIQDELWTEDFERVHIIRGAVGRLLELDIHDSDAPVKEVRSFLSARYERRFELNPQLFEQAVASVYRSLGYRAEATGFSNDGGIDVILRDTQGTRIGIQVKRYRGRIEVEHIRAFTGAMVLGGYTKGIFVTTSDYQAGVQKAVNVAHRKGIAIELVNAEQFLKTLRIAQRSQYRHIEDLELEVDRIRLTLLSRSDTF